MCYVHMRPYTASDLFQSGFCVDLHFLRFPPTGRTSKALTTSRKLSEEPPLSLAAVPCAKGCVRQTGKGHKGHHTT